MNQTTQSLHWSARSSAQWSASIDPPWDLDAWRRAARLALRANIAPEQIDWCEAGAGDLLAAPDIKLAPAVHSILHVPRTFLSLSATVLCHRDPQRLGLLYRLLWRLRQNPALLSVATDADIRRTHSLAQAVRRDAHKMKAFVRFRQLPGQPDQFIAWFEPEHRIVDRVASFFARRFTGMHWAILTPYRSVHWDGSTLAFGMGALRTDAPTDDACEALWRTYYANIFNPARLNTRMMQQEMPVRYWKQLPETQLLPTLIRESGARVRDMVEQAAADPP